MRLLPILVLVCLLGGYGSALAFGHNDTLSGKELYDLKKATINSTFNAYRVADSFSKAGDSINAGKFLMLTDPYYLMYRGQTPDGLMGLLSNHFKLTVQVKEGYVKSFTKVYNSKKTEPYIQFKRMAEEVTRLRDEREQCMESDCYWSLTSQIAYTDSIHSAYLNKYILKNGWPTIANGSLYAGVVAMHDSVHFKEYTPILTDAVMKGQLTIDALKSFVYWRHWESAYVKWCMWRFYKCKFRIFEITEVLNDSLPANLKEIEDFASSVCADSVLFYYDNHDVDPYDRWWEKNRYHFHYKDEVFIRLVVDLSKYVCSTNTRMRYCFQNGLWSIGFMPSELKKPKVKMFVLYDSRSKQTYSFNKIITDKKLVTHAIHFDVNSSIIKPESMGFVQELAAWLRQNPTVNLEIDGHTDNDGDAAANMKLSQERADEVKQQLVMQGVGAVRLTSKGFGASKPVKDNATPEGKAENRRVEFIRQ